MDFEKDDSLEVDAILERIKNRLSMRNSNPSPMSSVSHTSSMSQNFSSGYSTESDNGDDEYYDDDDIVAVKNASRGNVGEDGKIYSSPRISKPLFLNEDARNNGGVIDVADPNVIPNPFGHSALKRNVASSNPSTAASMPSMRIRSIPEMMATNNNRNASQIGGVNGLTGGNRTSGVIDLTPNMELHSMDGNRMQNYDTAENNVIDISLNDAEYRLLVDVLSKRFCKAFSIKHMQGKIEKWLDTNLKDLLASK